MKTIKTVLLSSIFIIAAFMNSAAFAKEPVSKSFVGSSAIGQHDTTAYHLNNTAAKGDKRFAFEWKGAQWHFATAEQRDLFAANPEKYSPAYNGFCSNALTLDEGLIRTDGTVWHIFGDQLHLFFAERGRVRWVNGDYDKLKKEADAAWKVELAKFN
ncbi:MAG: YHS domain-containing (seleno)protein [Arenicella sp.]